MNVLLLSMPDSFEHMPSVAIRMPNGALASLAGNLDPQHRVAIAMQQHRQPDAEARPIDRLLDTERQSAEILGVSMMIVGHGIIAVRQLPGFVVLG